MFRDRTPYHTQYCTQCMLLSPTTSVMLYTYSASYTFLIAINTVLVFHRLHGQFLILLTAISTNTQAPATDQGRRWRGEGACLGELEE